MAENMVAQSYLAQLLLNGGPAFLHFSWGENRRLQMGEGLWEKQNKTPAVTVGGVGQGAWCLPSAGWPGTLPGGGDVRGEIQKSERGRRGGPEIRGVGVCVCGGQPSGRQRSGSRGPCRSPQGPSSQTSVETADTSRGYTPLN